MAKKTAVATDDAPAQLAELRAEILVVKAELAAVPAAPLPLAEAERALDWTLEQMASYYDPEAALWAFIADPAPRLDALEGMIPDARFDPMGLRAFLAATIGEALRVVLLARLRTRYAADPELGETAIPLAERPGRLARLSARLRELELAEEQAIAASERVGLRIDRRADADPRILFSEEVIG